MSRFRLYPTPAQVGALLGHCAHARYVWNLGLEQRLAWRPGRRRISYAEQDRQLTEARAAFEWLRAGSSTVQQQALRDLDQAWRNFFAGTHRRPGWRRAGVHEGFRIVGAQARRVRQLNRRWSAVRVPKVGWVRFRRSRVVPEARSYRVRFKAGRWHIAFAAVPEPIPAPGTGQIVGVDRGVAVSLAYSDGRMSHAPRPVSVDRLRRRLSRAKPGSNRRRRALRRRLARAHARNADRVRDWVEKETTRVARAFDLIGVEDLAVASMTGSARGTIEAPGRNVAAKAGLNRAILASGWGAFVQRLEQKAPGRVERINPAYTSLTCSACGHRAAENRESQAVFCCRSCGYRSNADLNAARNIAAGHAARGATKAVASNREPLTTRPG